jgi:hypothetical protein
MIKYENSTLKIYIRNIKHYTDIDPTVDFVFPVNKIDRENSEKILSYDKLNGYSEAVTFENFPKN